MFITKYKKYKKKYLNLKMKGGSNYKALINGPIIYNNLLSSLVPYKIEFDEEYPNIPEYYPDLVNHTSFDNHKCVPMCAYDTCTGDDETILFTNGVIDCVVMILYNNLTKERYLTHLLKSVIFFDDKKSTALHDSNGDINLSEPYEEVSKTNGVCTVFESLPEWFNNKHVIAYFVSNGEKIKLYNRVQQLINCGFSGTIYTYYQKLNIEKIVAQSMCTFEEINAHDIQFFTLLNDEEFANNYINSECKNIWINSVGITQDNHLVFPIIDLYDVDPTIKKIINANGMLQHNKSYLQKFSFNFT